MELEADQLRRELRKAWQQLAELNWQLEAERNVGRKLARHLEQQVAERDAAQQCQDETFAEIEDEYGRTLADSKKLLHESQQALAAAQELKCNSERGGEANLDLVIRMLSVYAEGATNAMIAAVYRALQCRVQAVAIIQKELDRAGQSMQHAIEPALLGVISLAQEVNSDIWTPTLEIKLHDVPLRSDQLIRCGLITHEYLAQMYRASDGTTSGAGIFISLEAITMRLHRLTILVRDRVPAGSVRRIEDEPNCPELMTLWVGELNGRIEWQPSPEWGLAVTFPAPLVR